MSRPSPGFTDWKQVPLLQMVMARPGWVDSAMRRLMTSLKGLSGSSGALRESVGEEVVRSAVTRALRFSGGHLSLRRTIASLL
jgi:hypothetical protein